MSEHMPDPNKKKQPGAEDDELNEARVDKFIAQETAEMEAGQSPVFPMSGLLKMERLRMEAERKNNKK